MTIRQKLAMTLAVAMLGVCFMGIANAQTVPVRTLKLTWVNPTAFEDGSPLAVATLTSIQVFLSLTNITDPAATPTAVLTPLTGAGTVTFPVPAGGTLFIRLKSCIGAVCSAYSVQANKVVPVSTVPMPPTNLTIIVSGPEA